MNDPQPHAPDHRDQPVAARQGARWTTERIAAAPTLTFLGGVGTVTGSKYLVETSRSRVLLECGLFQGLGALRRRNWDAPPFDPASLDAVVLSHAHLDHSGYLPALVRHGFRGPVYCTRGTADLLPIVLGDSAHLQEEEAARANRHGYSKHRPALPLYTREDVARALEQVVPWNYGKVVVVAQGVRAIFRRAGHILGSATVELGFDDRGAGRLVFSGDLGRTGRPILRDPDVVEEADVLMVESTYGDRLHPPDPLDALRAVIAETAARGGCLVVPAFAIGRTQELIWAVRRLEDAGQIPPVSVHVDSPMALDVSALYCRHPEDHALEMTDLMDAHRCPLCCRQYHLVRTADES